MIVPKRLARGSVIYVTDTSNSPTGSRLFLEEGIRVLEREGFTVILAGGIYDHDGPLRFAPADQRAKRLAAGVTLENVDMILAAIGGSDGISLVQAAYSTALQDLVQHKLAFSGFSDNTVICAALHHLGLVAYCGPSAVDFPKAGAELTMQWWKSLVCDGTLTLDPSAMPTAYFDSPAKVHENTLDPVEEPLPFPPVSVFRPTPAQGVSGTIIGGNLGTFSRMPHMYRPHLNGCVLILEASGENDFYNSMNELTGILSAPGTPAAICLGTFQSASFTKKEPTEEWEALIRARLEQLTFLDPNIPVIFGLPFGHISPRLTVPIGGQAHLVADQDGNFRLTMTT